MLDDAGATRVQIGINFAGAMFNRAFAQLVEDAAWRYVREIDDHLERGQRRLEADHNAPNRAAFERWSRMIKTNRLNTYDKAGNMYLGGGLPHGVDIVSFDFYLSTLLSAHKYNDVPAWLAEEGFEACAPFAGRTMREVRGELSFFGGPLSERETRNTLNRLYDCRVGSTVDLLLREIEVTDNSPASW